MQARRRGNKGSQPAIAKIKYYQFIIILATTIIVTNIQSSTLCLKSCCQLKLNLH